MQHFQSLNIQRFPEGFCARFLHQRLVLYRHWSCHGSLVNWVLMAHWRRITLPDWTCLAIADSRCWPHGFSAFSFVGVMTITQQSSLLSNYASLPTFYMDLCKALVGHQKIAPFHRLTIFFWTGIDGCCSKGCHHSGLSGFRSPPSGLFIWRGFITFFSSWCVAWVVSFIDSSQSVGCFSSWRCHTGGCNRLVPADDCLWSWSGRDLRFWKTGFEGQVVTKQEVWKLRYLGCKVPTKRNGICFLFMWRKNKNESFVWQYEQNL